MWSQDGRPYATSVKKDEPILLYLVLEVAVARLVVSKEPELVLPGALASAAQLALEFLRNPCHSEPVLLQEQGSLEPPLLLLTVLLSSLSRDLVCHYWLVEAVQ